MIIKYKTGVMKPCGWRQETVTACTEPASASGKMLRVIEVLDVGGYGVTGYSTGANRQRFHVAGIAARELGARKRLACVEVQP